MANNLYVALVSVLKAGYNWLQPVYLSKLWMTGTVHHKVLMRQAELFLSEES
jgi:hypothetical protein